MGHTNFICQQNLLMALLEVQAQGWLSAGKNLRGGGGGGKRPLFFKTIGYRFYCSFYFFLKILEGKRPLPPVAESQKASGDPCLF